MTSLLVPLKPLQIAKSRLSQRLSAAQRRDLCIDMLERVLSAAGQAHSVDRVVIQTACPELREWAQARPVDLIADPVPSTDLAGVIDHGVRSLRRQHRGDVMVAMGDLPRLTGHDLDQLHTGLKDAHVALAPDSSEAGTNGIALREAVELPTCFGRGDSFEAHRARCEDLGLTVHIVRQAGFVFDVDTVADWERYLRDSEIS